MNTDQSIRHVCHLAIMAAVQASACLPAIALVIVAAMASAIVGAD